jgi:hypothetical protein
VKLTTHIKVWSKVKKNGDITHYSTIQWNCHGILVITFQNETEVRKFMLYLTVSGISCPADGHSGMKLCNEMCKNVI